jgi:hypothetical protein
MSTAARGSGNSGGELTIKVVLQHLMQCKLYIFIIVYAE